jgi:multimeric flavodoxin WrbA
MKITILNGDINDTNSDFTMYLNKLEGKLKKENEVVKFDLKSMNLKYCTGCWSCWWKTPGLCAIKDDGEEIFRTIINSDFVIFASPLVAGFVSSELKKVTDRLVSLLHPYIIIKEKEFHHRKRYDSYPDFGVIIQAEEDTDQEDIRIVSDIYDRLALNFHATKKYLRLAEKSSIKDIAYETCNN